LQLTQFYKDTSALDVVLFLIGVIIIIAALIVVNRQKSRLGITNSKISTPQPKRTKSPSLRKISRSMGLNPAQTQMFSYVMENGGVDDVEQTIRSPALLDRYFRNAYYTIEQAKGSEDEIQQNLSLLFSTRNILEAVAGGGQDIDSSRAIREHTPAILALYSKEYTVRTVSSKGAYLLVENPVDGDGDPIEANRNTPVTLSFFTNSSNGFSIRSTVYGSTKVPGEGRVLQIVHTNTIKRLSKRRFRRREIVIPVEFHTVRLERAPGNKEPKMIVDKQKGMGSILDISVGGCSIQTSGAVSAGARVKINLMIEKRQAVALGEVLRTNRNRTATVLYTKFLKIPRRSLNMINALVFEYLDI
jgi:hypothetical protein